MVNKNTLFRPEPLWFVAVRALVFTAVVYVIVKELPNWDLAKGAIELPTDPIARLDDILDQIGNVFLPLVAVGLVTSAFVEAMKSFVRPRAFYHKCQILRWLKGYYTDTQVSDVSAAYEQLVDLSSAGDEWALLRLQSEDMLDQINAGVDIAMDNGHTERNSLLVRRVAWNASELDLDTVLSESTEEPIDTKRAARSRVSALVQRRIEGLEIRIRSSWAAYLHATSFGVSAAIVYWAYNGVYSGRTLIAFALIAAAVAPIARDIVAAITNARSKLS